VFTLTTRPSNGPNVHITATDMTSYGTTAGVSVAARRHHAKLHKRGGSGSSTSLPGPPSALRSGADAFTTPFATYEEPAHYVVSTPPSTASTPKLKPYMRKMSKDDQGQLDLSRSTAENERLAGLGIDGARSAGDVSFAHSNRRQTSHSRTISGGSQVSNGSSGPKVAQPFVHPMRQVPRPYTPPLGPSYAPSSNDDEANESSDVLDDDFRLGHGFRTRRSVSIGSTPQIPPTPLSQSHTASDLGLVPKLTSPSLTNLSIKSTKSSRSTKPSRPRNETNRSAENAATTPSSRTSLDKAFSFVSRKSDLESQSRDERIRAARRKFEEKEAGKERRAEKESQKRERDERHRLVRQQRPSEDFPRAPAPEIKKIPPPHTERKKGARKDSSKCNNSMNEKLAARPYEGYKESNEASLPIQGRAAGSSEKAPRTREYRAKPAQGGFKRFETWFKTRMLSCGEERG